MVRVRFAPSPTGFLHVGAARTALFNWLYARRHGGIFILRIEDTDRLRSSEDMTEEIIKGLTWMGLDWDEGPLRQSERLDLYRDRAEELVRRGAAYHCYCSPGDVREDPPGDQDNGDPWARNRCCAALTSDQRKAFESSGRPKAVKFLVPEDDIEFDDLIHGRIRVKGDTVEDFVLLRSDGLPTYHLSVVVDDIDMAVTHVIRGDDHISNTPKQLLLYRALGVDPPRFGHLALILGPDKKKLSKRHGVTSVLQFREEGYLPLALVNFLAQMSWKPGEEDRIYSLAEMEQRFDLKRVYRGSPVFDLDKLGWLNGQLITGMTGEELYRPVKSELEKQGLWSPDLEGPRRGWLTDLLELLKPRNRTLLEFPERARPFLSDDYPIDSEAVRKYLDDDRLPMIWPRLKQDFSLLPDFDAGSVEGALRSRAEREEVKPALLIHALRVLLLGMKVSPGLFEVLELLGKEKTLKRMDRLTRVMDEFGLS